MLLSWTLVTTLFVMGAVGPELVVEVPCGQCDGSSWGKGHRLGFLVGGLAEAGKSRAAAPSKGLVCGPGQVQICPMRETLVCHDGSLSHPWWCLQLGAFWCGEACEGVL